MDEENIELEGICTKLFYEADDPEQAHHLFILSLAISSKRIADSLEYIANSIINRR